MMVRILMVSLLAWAFLSAGFLRRPYIAIRKYNWAVQSGAAEVVEMLEKMAREKKEDRREQIALEARGKLPYRARPSPDVAGPSRSGPASPRGGAPRAISSPSHKYVGTIPKFRGDRGTVAQEERARHRENCGYRGGEQQKQKPVKAKGTPGQRWTEVPPSQLCRGQRYERG